MHNVLEVLPFLLFTVCFTPFCFCFPDSFVYCFLFRDLSHNDLTSLPSSLESNGKTLSSLFVFFYSFLFFQFIVYCSLSDDPLWQFNRLQQTNTRSRTKSYFSPVCYHQHLQIFFFLVIFDLFITVRLHTMRLKALSSNLRHLLATQLFRLIFWI